MVLDRITISYTDHTLYRKLPLHILEAVACSAVIIKRKVNHWIISI